MDNLSSYPQINYHYLERYHKFIKSYKKLNLKRAKGCERHYIMPLGLGGAYDSDNLVWLPIRARIIAHHMLYLIYKQSSNYEARELTVLAFSEMTRHKDIKVSSRIAILAKDAVSEVLLGDNN